MTVKSLSIGFIVSIVGLSGLTHAASFYQTRLDDPAAIYLTPKDFPVFADGVGDDSAALQQSIDRVASRSGAGVLFIPEGRYRLTKTIYVWPGIRLIGYGKTRPVFTLGANTPGFQAGENKYMLYFSGGRGRGDGPPRDGGAGTFYGAMSNIDVKIGPGNPAAIGIRFHVAQHSYLSHMEFELGSALAGVRDIGNEVEDLHFHGGQFGILTKRSAPGWPILVLDCTFEGQSQAAISCEEAGLAIVRPTFKHMPTAIAMVQNKPDELWLSDAHLEDITGPALVISNEYNARTQVNAKNLTCQTVPILARFRESGKEVTGRGDAYVVEQFSHGLHISDLGMFRRMETTRTLREIATLPAPVKTDIPALPASDTWVNVRTLGARGDGQTDDTAILKAAIEKYRAIYLPTGWYNVSDTLTLKPDTILIGLNPSTTVINLPNNTPAFTGQATPRPVIEAPHGGTNILTGLGVYTGAVNPRAVGVKWRAGARSMVNDVRFHGGHGTRVPGERTPYGRQGNREAWNSQHTSLWVTQGGGGTFKDIWTPSPYASSGMEISDTATSGRVYAMSIEHHVSREVVIRNASNWQFYAMQFEEEREEGPKALPLEIDHSNNLQFANTFFYRVISCFVPFPHAVKVTDSKDIRFRNLHCYSNSKVSFDSTVFDATTRGEVRDTEFAVLDVTGNPLPMIKRAPSVILADGARIEKLCDGFLNIAGATVNARGQMYFADACKNRIYAWSQKRQQAHVVRELEQRPEQLAFDQAGNLWVVCYNGDGSVLAFDPEDEDSDIQPLKPQPAAERPGMTAMLPVNRWMDNDAFERDSTEQKPYHYVSPDHTIFIPAAQDFTSGATMWGTKMADVLRTFRLAPAPTGQRFYVTNEAELKTWSFAVGLDGTLSEPRLFAQEGGENVTVDVQGNVYIAAGQILVFSPSGKYLDTIKVPQRPTSLVFGGPDKKTLFITARSSLYSVRTRFAGL